MLGATVVGTQHPHTAQQNRHLRRSQAHQLGAVQKHLFRFDHIVFLLPVTEAIRQRLQRLERCCIGHLVGGIATAFQERHVYIMASGLGRHLDAQVTAQYDDISDARAGVG